MKTYRYRRGHFRRTFNGRIYDQYRERHGQPFTVVRGHARCVEGGHVYRIRFKDGVEIDAWGEEVCKP